MKGTGHQQRPGKIMLAHYRFRKTGIFHCVGALLFNKNISGDLKLLL